MSKTNEANTKQKKDETNIKITDDMVKDFLQTILMMEQENLYIRKHGLTSKILEEVKKRVR